MNSPKHNQFPRLMYHATNRPVMVYTAQQQADLGTDYSDEYIPQKYPSWRYHWTKPPRVVNNPEEDAALGGGWADTPAAFERYKDPTRCRPQKPDPSKWVDAWSVPDLTPDSRQRIKAHLFSAHAAFWKSPDDASAPANGMRLAFDGIARVLFDVGILTVQILEYDIPSLVWDSAIAGGWWHLASQAREDIFPEQVGHHWVWRDESEYGPTLFRAETAYWQGVLLDAPKAGASVVHNRKPVDHTTQSAPAATPPRKSPARLLNESRYRSVSERKSSSPRPSVWNEVYTSISRLAGRLARKPTSKQPSTLAATQAN
jgi:hypothetical protein